MPDLKELESFNKSQDLNYFSNSFEKLKSYNTSKNEFDLQLGSLYRKNFGGRVLLLMKK